MVNEFRWPPEVIKPCKGELRRPCPKGYEQYNEDWYLSPTGDMAYTGNLYPIYDYQLEQNDWMIHLMEKKWFDANTFIPAYFEACKRKGIQYLLIQTYYQK